MMSTGEQQRWRVVVPVKGQLSAKSRLHPPAGLRRSDLAHAFAIDTLTAAHACTPVGRLLVVTSDELTRDWARERDVDVTADPGSGLNDAVRAGLEELEARYAEGPTAVLLGDLPTLRSEDLARALAACCEHERSFVPDADGTGTVLLAAHAAGWLTPRFGSGSAHAHERDYTRLELDLPHLRSDVDDDVALARAVSLGVGPRTAQVLASRRH
jgi:2-phospho-L-lactate guanylyltransferase